MTLILLIEDDKILRENTQELLIINGYKCITAVNGAEGIKVALASKPDLILCDIMLPILDGYEIKNALNKVSNMAALPFIYLTAKTSREDHRHGMDLGAADYITKPFKIDEVLMSIKRRLQQSSDVSETVKVGVVDAVCDFVSIAKHECNTPLNAIINFSELIADAIDHDHNRICEMATYIKISGKRLHKTLNNLIEMVRLKHYQKVDSKRHKKTNIHEYLQYAASEHSIRYNRQDDLICNIDHIKSNKFLIEDLKILFAELIDNAFKFSKPGEKVRIELTIEPECNMVRFVIINPISSEFNFDALDIGPFKQFKREQHEQQGSGLGLYLSKLICENYAGSLTITLETAFAEVSATLKT